MELDALRYHSLSTTESYAALPLDMDVIARNRAACWLSINGKA
ncbi:hypothetical protein Pla110_37800 [Polystyrenella longa]|uniref:Uncharacterized protein n=1 Tax=Polystyrenella longa TaxID=2528007 RepID=A0A518CS20_9PLAN|nr:hypothetical protein Pla110_37800 [Polystyrenella longa]